MNTCVKWNFNVNIFNIFKHIKKWKLLRDYRKKTDILREELLILRNHIKEVSCQRLKSRQNFELK